MIDPKTIRDKITKKRTRYRDLEKKLRKYDDIDGSTLSDSVLSMYRELGRLHVEIDGHERNLKKRRR